MPMNSMVMAGPQGWAVSDSDAQIEKDFPRTGKNNLI
jgi:hypothetical protein